jgi:predicted AAA+ superfamily ATPase
MRSLHPGRIFGTFQRANAFFIYPLSFHTLLNSFVLAKNATLLFSSKSELFRKNTRVGGTSRSLYEDKNETPDYKFRFALSTLQPSRHPWPSVP